MKFSGFLTQQQEVRFGLEDRILQELNRVTTNQIIQTTRLGIPPGRDDHLEYRFIDEAYVDHCTKKPKRPVRY